MYLPCKDAVVEEEDLTRTTGALLAPYTAGMVGKVKFRSVCPLAAVMCILVVQLNITLESFTLI